MIKHNKENCKTRKTCEICKVSTYVKYNNVKGTYCI